MSTIIDSGKSFAEKVALLDRILNEEEPVVETGPKKFRFHITVETDGEVEPLIKVVGEEIRMLKALMELECKSVSTCLDKDGVHGKVSVKNLIYSE
jgi:hypothetical protein